MKIKTMLLLLILLSSMVFAGSNIIGEITNPIVKIHVLSLDADYLRSDNTLYEFKTVQTPVYDTEVKIIKSYCGLNNSCYEDHNITYKYVKTYENIDEPTRKAGIVDYSTYLIGRYEDCGNYFVEYLTDQGDRNIKEYCRCFDYEIEKGTCREWRKITQ